MYYQFLKVLFNGILASTAASATRLYVASYAGTVSTLELKVPPTPDVPTTLELTYTATECAAVPSWLTLDHRKSLLYCTDRDSTTPTGTLNTFRTTREGRLVHLSRVPIISSAVCSAFYGDDGDGLAIATYQTSSFQTLDVSDPTAPINLQSWTYSLSQPGTILPNQEIPHPHQAALDPTGQFVIVPDLGADLVRILSIDPDSLILEPLDPLVIKPSGTGPRHVAFHVTNAGKTLLYVVGELSNTITAFEMVYQKKGPPRFQFAQTISTFGKGNSAPNGTTAAEIHIAPDGKFVIISSRNDKKFVIPNPDPNNSTQLVSDSIVTFAINEHSGRLHLSQVFEAGGRSPRHFSVNKAGTLIAVGLQSDGRVVVIDRDVSTGALKGFIASVSIPGEIVAVIFDE